MLNLNSFKNKITFLGAGNMTQAIVSGLVSKAPSIGSQINVVIKSEYRIEQLSKYQIKTLNNILDREALESDILFLSVKPQQVRDAIESLKGKLSNQVVVSLAVGLAIEEIKEWLGGYSKIVRVMPNTPSMISKGMSGIFATDEVNSIQREWIDMIMSSVGEVLWLDDEDKIDVVASISGSGPAYIFRFAESLVKAAIENGLTDEQASKLVIQTIYGSGVFLKSSEDSIQTLREKVTSKKGSTQEALKVINENNIDKIMLDVVEAAIYRAKEIRNELSIKDS